VADARQATLDSPVHGLEQLHPKGLFDPAEVNYRQVPEAGVPNHCPELATPEGCPLYDLQCPLLGGN
jgi:hypothetical protein